MPPESAAQVLHTAYNSYVRAGAKKSKTQFTQDKGYSEGSGSSDAPPDDDVAIDLTAPKDPMLHPTLAGKKGAPLPSPAAVPSTHLAGYEFKPLPRKMNYKEIVQWFVGCSIRRTTTGYASSRRSVRTRSSRSSCRP
jgi:hypothetical protein